MKSQSKKKAADWRKNGHLTTCAPSLSMRTSSGGKPQSHGVESQKGNDPEVYLNYTWKSYGQHEANTPCKKPAKIGYYGQMI